jgi:hypothetical protein
MLAERRERWDNQGFDADAISAHLKNVGGNMSESVIRLENAMVTALSLRRKVANWPHAWPERDVLLNALRNPTNVDACEQKWREIVRQRRPWVFTAETARQSWSREGRSDELRKWVERLETIDESMTPYAEDVMGGIESVAPINQMEELVLTLEQKQIRRTKILEDMITHLKIERGWEMTALQGNLTERYAEVNRIQEMDTVLGSIEEWVDEVISIFDPETASSLLQKATLAQKMEDGARLKSIEVSSEKMAADLSKRLDEITNWLSKLEASGLHINAPGLPQPSDLLTLESRVEGIEKMVIRLNDAWIKLDSLLTLFPEYAGDAIALQGQVEMVDKVESLLAILEDKRDEREQQSRARLLSWKESGFEVEPLETILNHSQKTGWLAIDEHAKKIQVCKQILATIDSIDVSFSGNEEATKWKSLLTSIDINNDDYEIIHDGIAKQLRRNRWHREKLDAARLEMSVIWPGKINPYNLSLLEYEDIITGLQSGTSIEKFAISKQSGTVDRLHAASIAEIDMWRQDGWDVSALDELVQRDHVELWVQLPALRKAVYEHAKLTERLLRLPLHRDEKLLEDVLMNSGRPDQLVRLTESIPEMAKHLSAMPDIGVRINSLFSPSPPKVFAKLHPLKPVLIPSIDEPKLIVKKESETVETEIVENSSDDGVNVEKTSPKEPESNILTPTISWNDSKSEETEPIEDTNSWSILWNKLGAPLDASPRDIRVQRLVRLTYILKPNSNQISDEHESLISRLNHIRKELEKWTIQRLERRQSSNKGNLSELSKRLAEKLTEIPGPGFDLPKMLDDDELPNANDLQAITAEIIILENATNLPLAGSKSTIQTIS